MFSKLRSVWGLCGLGLLCAVICVVCVVETHNQSVVMNATPNASSAYAIGLSLLGSIGFPVAALIKALLEKVLHLTPGTITDETLSDTTELTLAFSAMMKDVKSLPARRRFAFALADMAKLLPDFRATHDGGKLIIEYDGFMDKPDVASLSAAVAQYAAPLQVSRLEGLHPAFDPMNQIKAFQASCREQELQRQQSQGTANSAGLNSQPLQGYSNPVAAAGPAQAAPLNSSY